MPCYGYADDNDPEPLWWLTAVFAFVLYLILATVLRADPVPEPKPAEPQRTGNRGLTELRDPNTSAPSLARLLRSCTRCHGEAGPNRQLFDALGVPLWTEPREKLAWGVGVVIASTPGSRWYPSREERRDLLAAQGWLLRPQKR